MQYIGFYIKFSDKDNFWFSDYFTKTIFSIY